MKGKTMKRDKEEYLSWEEFKGHYLTKVERLAEILGLDRKQLIKDYKDLRPKSIRRQSESDDDYKFVQGVMDCISRCKNKTERQLLLRKLEESEGAKDVFNEIDRIWVFQSYFDHELYFPKIPGYGGGRSEPGKGEMVDIYLVDQTYGLSIIYPTAGEDYADGCVNPIVVKVKPNSAITDEDLVRALRDLADSLEADFKNCYLPSSDGYLVPSYGEQAILCGLYKNNSELHQDVKYNPGFPLDEAVKEAGWVDPNVSLDSGIGELLQKGWPELYENVLAGKMTPFEALVETGCVHPKDFDEACRNDKKTKNVVQPQESKDL
jgi:hypothetical protein